MPGIGVSVGSFRLQDRKDDTSRADDRAKDRRSTSKKKRYIPGPHVSCSSNLVTETELDRDEAERCEHRTRQQILIESCHLYTPIQSVAFGFEAGLSDDLADRIVVRFHKGRELFRRERARSSTAF